MKVSLRTYLFSALLLVTCSLFNACKSPAEQRVCFFGSSVCRGVGADALHGYAAQVTEALPAGWESVNISIDGNNTYDLFARFDRDMTPVEAKYVVIAAPTNYDSQKNYFDTSAVEQVIELVLRVNPNAIMVIKSTIPVGYCRSLYVKSVSYTHLTLPTN